MSSYPHLDSNQERALIWSLNAGYRPGVLPLNYEGVYFVVSPTVTVSAILTGYHGTPSRVDTLEFHNCLAFQVLFRSLDVIPYPFTHSPLVPWAIGLTPSGRIQLPCKLRSSYPLPLKDVYRTFIPLAHIRRLW